MLESFSRTHPTMLVADDDEILRERLSRALRDRGFEVWSASCADAARLLSERAAPHYALIDLRMPHLAGLQTVRALAVTTRLVIFAGMGSLAIARMTAAARSARWLAKPADVEEILAAFVDDMPCRRSQL